MYNLEPEETTDKNTNLICIYNTTHIITVIQQVVIYIISSSSSLSSSSSRRWNGWAAASISSWFMRENGLVSSYSSLATMASSVFNFSAPASQVVPSLKQCVWSSAEPSVGRFLARTLNDLEIISFDRRDNDSRTYCAIFLRDAALIFPASVNSCKPSANHWSYFSVI